MTKDDNKNSLWRRLRISRSKPIAAEPQIDEDSGLPASHWLDTQARELEDRSLSERTSIAVLKLQISDHGRATDEELADVAGRLQSCLRAYDRLFRVGRRDFVLLAPGSDLRKAQFLGRKLRDRVGSVSLWRGGRMDLECGASASVEGEPFVYEWVSAKADQALEQADLHGGVAVIESVQRDRLRAVGGE